MVGFDDAAMMGLGVVNAGVQAYGAHKQKKQQRKAGKIQKEGARRDLAFQQKELDESKVDTNFNFDEAIKALTEESGDRGIQHSSIRQDDENRQNYLRNRRLSAIDRQKAQLAAQGMDQERLWKIDKKMKKTQDMMNMISSALLQGGSGVAGGLGMTMGQ